MANNVLKVNGIAIADIAKINGQNDTDLAKLNGEEFTGTTYTVATGGTITTDGDYKVHTFNSSGTFTVTTAGTAGVEYLIIAGGGGGGGSNTSQGSVSYTHLTLPTILLV